MKLPEVVRSTVIYVLAIAIIGILGHALYSIVINEQHTATVVRVIDGDTIDVRYRDAPRRGAHPDNTERVRFVGIDTPELGRVLRERILGETVAIQRDGRKLRYVYHNGQDIGYLLLATCHAEIYDRNPFDKEEKYREAEC